MDTDLINRPMVSADVEWVLRHDLTKAMREFVESCANNDVPFWNGNLRNNTFNSAGGRFKTLNWYRLWEYASCYDLFVKRHPAGSHFVDFGGAGCYFSFFLAAQGFKITIVDIDPYLIDITNAIARKLCLEKNLTGVCGEISALGRPAFGPVSGLYSISVIEHVPQSRRLDVLRSVKRLVGKGGLVFLSFDYGEFSSSYIDAVRSLSHFSEDFEASGFVLEGNAYTPEMDSLISKPYGPYFYAIYDDVATFSHADPLWPQVAFALKTLALKLRWSGAKEAAKRIFKIKRQDYNFCRLLVRG